MSTALDDAVPRSAGKLERGAALRNGAVGPPVEVRDVVLPENMKRVMARQAEVERDRRAKVIHAQGEFQAAARLVEAAEMMRDHPIAVGSGGFHLEPARPGRHERIPP